MKSNLFTQWKNEDFQIEFAEPEIFIGDVNKLFEIALWHVDFCNACVISDWWITFGNSSGLLRMLYDNIRQLILSERRTGKALIKTPSTCICFQPFLPENVDFLMTRFFRVRVLICFRCPQVHKWKGSKTLLCRDLPNVITSPFSETFDRLRVNGRPNRVKVYISFRSFLPSTRTPINLRCQKSSL